MDPITTGAIIMGGASLLGGLSGSRARRKAAQTQAQVAREQLAQDRLFKRLALKYGWAGRSAQNEALKQAPKQPMPGPTRTGSTMDALGQIAGAGASTYQSYLNMKNQQAQQNLWNDYMTMQMMNQSQGQGMPGMYGVPMGNPGASVA